MAVNFQATRRQLHDFLLPAGQGVEMIAKLPALRLGLALRGFTAEAHALLLDYGWPGNVRELENRMQRAVIMSQDAYLRPEDLELESVGGSSDPLPTLQSARDEAERRLLVEALTRNAGNVTRAARDIEVSRPTLHDLLRKHGLEAARFRRGGAAEPDDDEPGSGS